MRSRVWPFGLSTAILGMLVGGAAVPDDLPDRLGRLPATELAVLLLVLGWGLARRRLVAWVAGVLVLAALGVAIRYSWWSAALLGYALGLALCHAAFVAWPDRGHLKTALRLAAVVAVGSGLYLVAGHLRLVRPVGWPVLAPLVTLVLVVAALRAAPPPEPSGPAERDRVRRLVTRPGADTLAPFVLRADKTYLFSANGSAAVGYRVLAGVAVVGGDPVGDPAGFPEVIDRFLALCARRGWRPAVLGARGDLASAWRAHGLRSIGIGDEVILDVAGFTLTTRRMRNVRQAVARTRNAGVTTRVVRAGRLAERQRAELAALSARSLGSARQRGFAMILDGLFDDRHPDALFALAFDRTGRVVAFQRYLECGSGAGRALSLDTMRREPRGFNGLHERLIVDIVRYAADRGIGRVSLNFAAFRALLDRGGRRGPAERLGYRLVHLLDPFIQVESLYRFNAKFRPGYLPRDVVLDSWLAVPSALIAMLGLEFALPYDARRRHAEAAEDPVGPLEAVG